MKNKNYKDNERKRLMKVIVRQGNAYFPNPYRVSPVEHQVAKKVSMIAS